MKLTVLHACQAFDVVNIHFELSGAHYATGRTFNDSAYSMSVNSDGSIKFYNGESYLEVSEAVAVRAAVYGRLVEHDGIEYLLAQDAYAECNGARTRYQASAIRLTDAADCLIYWDIITDDNQGDFSNDCHWESPSEIIEL